MFFHYKNIKEEVDYYERQNKRYAVEDLLRLLSKKKQKYNRRIRENERRIKKLWWRLTDLIAP